MMQSLTCAFVVLSLVCLAASQQLTACPNSCESATANSESACGALPPLSACPDGTSRSLVCRASPTRNCTCAWDGQTACLPPATPVQTAATRSPTSSPIATVARTDSPRPPPPTFTCASGSVITSTSCTGGCTSLPLLNIPSTASCVNAALNPVTAVCRFDINTCQCKWVPSCDVAPPPTPARTCPAVQPALCTCSGTAPTAPPNAVCADRSTPQATCLWNPADCACTYRFNCSLTPPATMPPQCKIVPSTVDDSCSFTRVCVDARSPTGCNLSATALGSGFCNYTFANNDWAGQVRQCVARKISDLLNSQAGSAAYATCDAARATIANIYQQCAGAGTALDVCRQALEDRSALMNIVAAGNLGDLLAFRQLLSMCAREIYAEARFDFPVSASFIGMNRDAILAKIAQLLNTTVSRLNLFFPSANAKRQGTSSAYVSFNGDSSLSASVAASQAASQSDQVATAAGSQVTASAACSGACADQATSAAPSLSGSGLALVLLSFALLFML